MGDRRRDELTARALLTLGVLVPYWRLLTFTVVFVTDDFFSSDIFNGELPGRLLVGQLLGAGHAPVWTSAICSGVPLTGAPAEPIGLLAFALLPPAPALDLLLIVLLLVAAHGAYDLARRVGAGRPGAVLAGLAFAGSGYIACQLKHVAIVSTVVWLPVGLALLDRALAFTRAEGLAAAAPRDPPPSPPTLVRRLFFIAAFGLVFAEQVLAGFPQSAYICGLVYGPFAVFRALTNHQRIGRYSLSPFLLVGVAAATALGAAGGAVVLLPISAAGALSDRSASLGWQWSTMAPYWPPNALTFLVPYVNGDISDNTYRGPSLFWEDYGYVGAATLLLAIYGALREWRRPMVQFLVAMTTAAYLMVLGPATVAFRLAYAFVPGMDLFRFPTRFLIVVELGLAVLAALALTRLSVDLTGWLSSRPGLPRLIVLALCAGTAVDLAVHQPRQNPMVPAEQWLAPPPTVEAIRADTPQPRTLTPHHDALHRATFARAAGWSNVAPYFEMRDLLQPNIGGAFWNVPSGDCYAGLAPRWYVDVWGDHIRRGSVVPRLSRVSSRERTLVITPQLAPVLKAFGVSHVLSRFPAHGAPLALMGRHGSAYIYRIDGAARVRVVRAARHVNDREGVARLLSPGFDPDREILLHDAPSSIGPRVDDADPGETPVAASRAVITREGPREVVIEAVSEHGGFLLLADTFYPGWSAEVDGVGAQIYRANVSVRAVPLKKGRHVVRFEYEAPAFFRGLRVTILSLCALLLWMVVAAVVDWRSRWRQTAP